MTVNKTWCQWRLASFRDCHNSNGRGLNNTHLLRQQQLRSKSVHVQGSAGIHGTASSTNDAYSHRVHIPCWTCSWNKGSAIQVPGQKWQRCVVLSCTMAYWAPLPLKIQPQSTSALNPPRSVDLLPEYPRWAWVSLANGLTLIHRIAKRSDHISLRPVHFSKYRLVGRGSCWLY